MVATPYLSSFIWADRCMIDMNEDRYGVATISRLLKIQVSFAKEPSKRDDILQKRPIIFRSLLIAATPYVYKATKMYLSATPCEVLMSFEYCAGLTGIGYI